MIAETNIWMASQAHLCILLGDTFFYLLGFKTNWFRDKLARNLDEGYTFASPKMFTFTPCAIFYDTYFTNAIFFWSLTWRKFSTCNVIQQIKIVPYDPVELEQNMWVVKINSRVYFMIYRCRCWKKNCHIPYN